MSSAATPSPSGQQPQYVEEPSIAVFTVTLNASGAGSAFTKVAVPVDRDADFLLTGVNGSSTGDYTINLYLPSGRQMASSSMQNANFVSPDPQQPTAILAAPLYRAGSNGPSLDVANTSGAPNSIEIEFSGIRRLRTA
jgi:hypothetical protein